MNKLSYIISELERIYDIFAERHGLKCPRPLICIQSRGRSETLLGWYSSKRWKRGEEEVSEITLAAERLNYSPVETLLHEMAHFANDSLGIADCNSQGYHNTEFKSKAEEYGLNVEKSGRRGWAHTSISPELQKYVDTLKINYDLFNILRQGRKSSKAPTKMKKFTCSCTTIRCATSLAASCKQCGQDFVERL